VADKFAFAWEHWQALDLQCVYMTHVWRQAKDVEFGRFLERLREGQSTEADLEKLAERAALGYTPPEEGSDRLRPVHLVPRTKQVIEINKREFEKLAGPVLERSQAQDELVERVTDAQGRVGFVPSNAMTVNQALEAVGKTLDMRMPKELEIKEGMTCILTRNREVSRGQTNGASCVCELDYDDGGACERDNEDENEDESGRASARAAAAHLAVTVAAAAAAGGAAVPPPAKILYMRFRNGSRVRLASLRATDMQVVFGHPNLFVRRRQYTLRLGYAATFHGCQGATYDEAVIDLSSVPFAAAAYVGLGRVREWANVHLTGFHPKSLRTHKEALRVSRRLRAVYLASLAPPSPLRAASSAAAAAAASAAPVSYSLAPNEEDEEDEEEYKEEPAPASAAAAAAAAFAPDEDDDEDDDEEEESVVFSYAEWDEEDDEWEDDEEKPTLAKKHAVKRKRAVEGDDEEEKEERKESASDDYPPAKRAHIAPKKRGREAKEDKTEHRPAKQARKHRNASGDTDEDAEEEEKKEEAKEEKVPSSRKRGPETNEVAAAATTTNSGKRTRWLAVKFDPSRSAAATAAARMRTS
jgi:hypothetical protein